MGRISRQFQKSQQVLLDSFKSRGNYFLTVSKVTGSTSRQFQKSREVLLHSFKSRRKYFPTVSKVAASTSRQFQKLREVLLDSFKSRRKYFLTVSKVVGSISRQFQKSQEVLLDSFKSRGNHLSTVSRVVGTFKNGAFPDCLKEANVTPIFKKDGPLDKEKYRPVSTVSKVPRSTSRQFQKSQQVLLDSFKIRRKYFLTVSKVVGSISR